MRLLVPLTVLWLAGCTAPALIAANPYPPPPPPRDEVVPISPVSEDPLVWRPGSWDWDGSGGYVWTAGKFVSTEGHSNQWLQGYWSNVDGRWVWVRAHWV